MFTWKLKESSSAERFSNARALAISPTLGIIICSEAHTSTLVGFRLPDVVADTTLTAEFTITSPEPCTALCGWMTFTDDDYLLVANFTQGAVFIFDVPLRKFIGFMCGPTAMDLGSPRPHDVASRGMLTAVSERINERKPGAVALYQRREGLQWVLLRRIFYTADVNCWAPGGLAFSTDGDTLAVTSRIELKLVDIGTGIGTDIGTDIGTGSLEFETLFSDFERGRYIADVEECDDGWAMLVGGDYRVSLFASSSVGSLHYLGAANNKAAAVVHVRPCHLLVFSDFDNKLFACLTPAGAAMAAMSAVRVAWMSAVARST